MILYPDAIGWNWYVTGSDVELNYNSSITWYDTVFPNMTSLSN